MGSNVFKFPGSYSFSASGHDTGGIHAVTVIQALSIPSFRRRPKAPQAQPIEARESWLNTAQRRGALRLIQAAGTSAAAAEPISSARAQPLRVLRLVEAGQAPGTAGRLRMSGRLADVCAELDRMASEDSSGSHALRA